MKSRINIVMVTVMLLSVTFVHAQIKNPKTETVKVFGNCKMCKKTIEKSGSIKGIAKVEWDMETNMAVLTFDTTMTDANAILDKIAKAGYDSAQIKASNAAYSQLPHCCQYDRNTNLSHSVK